jgi:hypothetical protein
MMDFPPMFSEGDINQLLVSFEQGDPGARTLLPKLVGGRLLRIAKRLAPDFDAGQHQDVVQEMWAALSDPEHRRIRYDPSRGSYLSYLTYRIRDAVKRMRAAYAPAGVNTRRPYDEARNSGLENCEPTLEYLVGETGEGIESTVSARQVIHLAAVTDPRVLGRSLQMIYECDLPFAEAAVRVGVSRFSLRRRLDLFARVIS